jgi:hypothetical protein
MLVVHQAILLPTMQHNLLATMQLRLNDVIVNDVPKFLTDKPNELTHTIIVSGQSADPTDRLVIPLTIHGVTSSFPTRKPSAQEYESCPHYDLTFETPDYDPHDPTYSRQEQVALDALALPETGDRVRRIMSVSSSTAQARDIHDYYSRDNAILSDISHVLEPRLFLHDLESSRMIATVKSISQRPGIDAETLSRNWGIGLASARRTLEATTQRGVRTVLHPTMSRRFRTNDRQLRYRRLPVDMYTDTMFSKTKSRRGNTCAQVFSTANG